MQNSRDAGGSPPCMAHQLVGGHAVDPETRRDVARFRQGERMRLYGQRRAMTSDARAAQTARVTQALDLLFGERREGTVAVYWPIRGELDLRPWMTRLHARGLRVALPVVTQKNRPVEFHHWTPRGPMTRGIWNIPVPAEAQKLQPDTVVIPLVGVDRDLFRLGNGGGYYDMTLAGFCDMPRRVGVGQDFCLLPTIFPQPWDVPMETVILGDGTVLHRARNDADD